MEVRNANSWSVMLRRSVDAFVAVLLTSVNGIGFGGLPLILPIVQLIKNGSDHAK